MSFLRRNALLLAAVLVPVVYFGAQAAAAPFFPNYSVFTTSASALGSDLSSRPGILNTGAFLTGVLALLGGVGCAGSLPRRGVGRAAAFLLGVCLISLGVASIWASLHPLPDPRHNPGALGFGMFLLPFASTWAAGHLRLPASLFRLFLANALAFVACGVVMSGATGLDLAAYGGLVQKLIAFTAMASSAAVAAIAMRRTPQDRS